MLVYLAAAIVGVFQLTSGAKNYGAVLRCLILAGVVLCGVLLGTRAAAIRAIPLTRLFESMIVLTIIFGLTYLVLSAAIRQVWFGSVIGWVILVLVLIAGSVITPASKANAAAATPWAIAHGIAMILGIASMLFSATSAFLYLFGKRKLKQKKLSQVVGKMPNLEKLEQMNEHSLEVCFLFLTFGLVSGFGMAVINSAALETSIVSWLTDAKIVLIEAVWVILGAMLVLKRTTKLKGGTAAYMTIGAFALFLFAIVGTTVFCNSTHDFSNDDVNTVEVERQ